MQCMRLTLFVAIIAKLSIFFQFSLTRSQDEVSLPGTSTATWSFVELLTAVLKLVTDTDSQDGCVGVILYLLNE